MRSLIWIIIAVVVLGGAFLLATGGMPPGEEAAPDAAPEAAPAPAPRSAQPGDDEILPFQLDRSDIRGRAARLDATLGDILANHDYPPATRRVL